METEEVIKLVDGIYKNILEKFNPGARQLISAGKAYLKALHGAAAASRLFNEALAKIAVNAQQGGTTDIGSALMSIVGVYKEIQDQHMNILKAFYVDLLVPLETNLEKDTKVVQFEQKKFLQHHKVRADSYSKAAATMKKQRKKKTNPQSAEKEIKSMQVMDEEKSKLDAFCEQSLKNAMTQERRRYGFVLERQCSLAKHWIAYHAAGKKEIENSVDNWNDVASSREFLPPNVESMFKKKIKDSMSEDDDASSTTSDRGSISSQLRKTRSIDASCMDMRSIGDVVNNSMNRAKSEYNLTSNTNLITAVGGGSHHNHNRHHNHNTLATTAQLQAHGSDINHWDQRPIARALYAYLSSGENQLSFLEGDRIALVGDRAKGWQFGENLRTQMFGWFPLAYTESEQLDENTSNWESIPKPVPNNIMNHQEHNLTPDSSLESTLVDEMASMSTNSHLHHKSNSNPYHDDVSPSRMFGDTIMYRQSKHFTRGVTGGGGGGLAGVGPKPGPPPTLPAPVPQPVVPPYAKNHQLISSHSFTSSAGAPNIDKRRSGPATMNLSKPNGGKIKQGRDGVTNASLHSSNDSGFANEPPPQPEVDYSDEETVTRVPIRSSRHEKIIQNNKSSPRQSQNMSVAAPQETATLQRRSHRRSNDDSAEVLTTARKSKSNNSENIRQSSSFGNLADENTIEFMYRTSERRSRSAKSHNNTHTSNSSGSNNNSNTDKNNMDDGSEDLLNGNVVKRTKSFWKFGKSDDDILAGMALWKHRDLVQTENEKNLEKKKEATLKRSNRNHNNNNNSNNSNNSNRNSNETHSSNLSHSNSTSSSETIKNNNNSNTNQTKRSSSNNNISNSNNNGNKNISNEIDQIAIIKSYPLTKSDIDNRISKHNVDADQIYGAVERRNTLPPPKNQTIDRTNDRSGRQQIGSNKHQGQPHHHHDMLMDDDDDMMIIKETTKRRTNETNNRASMKADSMKYTDDFYDDDNPDDNLDDDMSLIARENNFYDDDSVDDMMLMKTVKRKEILKQYYSSGTDTEHNSSSSDPYDCIVVDDHLVRKSEHIRTKTNNANNTSNNIINNNNNNHDKMEFTTFRGERNSTTTTTENNVKENNKDRVAATRTTSGTLLPRTKLSKTNNNSSNNNGSATLKNEKSDRRESDTQPRKNRNTNNTNNTNSNMTNNNKSYGPWYDLWGNDLPPIKNK